MRSTRRAIDRPSATPLLARGLVALSVLLGIALPLAVSAAWADSEAQGFLLIVHPQNHTPHATKEWVAQAFLKRVTRWDDGQTIKPVDLPPDATVRNLFSGAVLKRSVSAMRSYWQQRIFSGRELPPPELASDEAVVQYVLGTPGAIGYVAPTTQLHKVRVLAVR